MYWYYWYVMEKVFGLWSLQSLTGVTELSLSLLWVEYSPADLRPKYTAHRYIIMPQFLLIYSFHILIFLKFKVILHTT